MARWLQKTWFLRKIPIPGTAIAKVQIQRGHTRTLVLAHIPVFVKVFHGRGYLAQCFY